MIGIDYIEDVADALENCLNQDGKRERVGDILGKQQVDWEFYKQMEKHGKTLLLTSWGDGLEGFALYVFYAHPHHPDALLGQCMFLIVRPEFRGKGIGRSLVRCAMVELKKKNCTHIVHNRRMAYDVGPLFAKIGFTKVEEMYVKEL